ncbi:MAG TPA: hypothetical protein VGA37_14690 [Gemmatimonadales bacterium]
MLPIVQRLIRAILEIGLYQFLRRIGWRWAASAILIVLVLGLLVLVVVAMLIGVLM